MKIKKKRFRKLIKIHKKCLQQWKCVIKKLILEFLKMSQYYLSERIISEDITKKIHRHYLTFNTNFN